MTNVPMDDGLLQIAAEKHDVPFDILVALLALEAEFGDLTTPGARGEFATNIAEILDAGAERIAV
jgi:membrane-bound lytic murein transglycosylase B